MVIGIISHGMVYGCLPLVKNVVSHNRGARVDVCEICGEDVWTDDEIEEEKIMAESVCFYCTSCCVKLCDDGIVEVKK